MNKTMQTFPNNEEVDAVVIGTGAGGATVLARLAKAGLSVVALEAGRWHDPENEYATDEYAQHYLYWQDERLSGGEDPTAFGLNNSGCGVGGSTLHFGAYTPRAQPGDLRINSDFGMGEDWPFDYAELQPYYEQVEKFLGICGPENYPWAAESKRGYPLPPPPLNSPARLMQRGCKKTGVRTTAAPMATLSQPYSQPEYGVRPACMNCGYCHQGCQNGSKSSTDRTFIPAALQSGAEIRPESFVHGFETNANGLLSGVIYRNNGVEQRQRCRAVFLCAGAIETPRLLLYTGLANSSGQVGRNFMAHVATQVWGQFEEETRPYKGFPASLITEDTSRAPDADFAGGYLMQSLGIVPSTWAMQVARGTRALGESFARTSAKVQSLGRHWGSMENVCPRQKIIWSFRAS